MSASHSRTECTRTSLCSSGSRTMAAICSSVRVPPSKRNPTWFAGQSSPRWAMNCVPSSFRSPSKAMPVSSRHSRSAHSQGVSPWSMFPPGHCQVSVEYVARSCTGRPAVSVK